jgi:lipopolysaccharide/colanic/teichoic acid biosynthesis glycosyltransferase
MYKFRSMVKTQRPSARTTRPPTIPRITRTGRFIRRTSLDELPSC